MTHRNRALVVAALAFAAGPLAAQGTSSTAPAAPSSAPSTSASAATPVRPAAPFGGITYDRTGVGDTSLFAPLELTAPNIYRSGSGAPGPKYWQNRADYDIKASLDTTTKTLTGSLRMRYTNNSPATLHFI